jgi:hypothetical protein
VAEMKSVPYSPHPTSSGKKMESFLRPLQINCGGWFMSMRLRIMAGKRENNRVWTLRHLWRIVPVGPLHNQNIDVSDAGKEALLSWQ